MVYASPSSEEVGEVIIRRLEDDLTRGRFQAAAEGAVTLLLESKLCHKAEDEGLRLRLLYVTIQAMVLSRRSPELEQLLSEACGGIECIPLDAFMLWQLLLIDLGQAEEARRLVESRMSRQESSAALGPLVRLYAIDILCQGLGRPEVAEAWVKNCLAADAADGKGRGEEGAAADILNDILQYKPTVASQHRDPSSQAASSSNARGTRAAVAKPLGSSTHGAQQRTETYPAPPTEYFTMTGMMNHEEEQEEEEGGKGPSTSLSSAKATEDHTAPSSSRKKGARRQEELPIFSWVRKTLTALMGGAGGWRQRLGVVLTGWGGSGGREGAFLALKPLLVPLISCLVVVALVAEAQAWGPSARRGWRTLRGALRTFLGDLLGMGLALSPATSLVSHYPLR